VGGRGVAGAAQHSANQLGVGDVHLAAVRLDKNARPRSVVLYGLVHPIISYSSARHSGYQGFVGFVSFARVRFTPAQAWG
jgi:hypothetical protein